MAGPMDKSKLRELLLQAKLAAITAHEIRGRLLQLQVRLQAQTTTNSTTTATTPAGAGAARAPSEDVTGSTTTNTSSGGAGAALPSNDVTAAAATTTTPGGTGVARSFEEEIILGLQKAYFTFDIVARYMSTCRTMMSSIGVPPLLPARFSVISDEQLYEEMVALRLPEPPTTQRHAFARLEATFFAVKLPYDHLIVRCAHHFRRPDQRGMYQARTYLGRVCTCANLSATHIDLAVTAIESFLDPQDVAGLSAFASCAAAGHLRLIYDR